VAPVYCWHLEMKAARHRYSMFSSSASVGSITATL
jgi:hypothetical protein